MKEINQKNILIFTLLFIFFISFIFTLPRHKLFNARVFYFDANLKMATHIDWSSYMKDLEKDIKNNWKPPKANESKRVVAIFRITRDGKLASCKIKQSSGNIETDKAAIDAIKAATPFKPFPKNFKGTFIDIEFTFDYNILKTIQ